MHNENEVLQCRRHLQPPTNYQLNKRNYYPSHKLQILHFSKNLPMLVIVNEKYNRKESYLIRFVNDRAFRYK